MDFRVLGSLSVSVDGEELIHTNGKPRQLLALLLVNEPYRISAGSLITELWDDTPPRSALTTLQTHISNLRTEFARRLGVTRRVIARDLLQTRDGGYRINLGTSTSDLREFHRLRSLAQPLLNVRDALGAGRVLSEALGLWRGPALSDVDHGRLLRAAVAELDQSRLDTLALLFGAHLDLGRHREILTELARLVVRYPCHEELHAQFMIALCRSGHRTRAIEVFDELRRNMDRELGTAPATRLAALRQAIEVADPAAMDATCGSYALARVSSPGSTGSSLGSGSTRSSSSPGSAASIA